MKPKQILELIDGGESTTTEFKRKFSSPVKAAKEMAAFANTIGGYLLVGVDDDKTIVGVQSEKSEIDIIETAAKFFLEPPIEPEIEVASLYGKDVVVCYIRESPNKPHRLTEIDEEKKEVPRTYIRVGEKSVIASREMTRILSGMNATSKPITLSIGEKERRLFNYLEMHERATAKEFSRLVNISLRRAERLLVRLVRAGVLQIHVDSANDYFTLVENISEK